MNCGGHDLRAGCSGRCGRRSSVRIPRSINIAATSPGIGVDCDGACRRRSLAGVILNPRNCCLFASQMCRRDESYISPYFFRLGHQRSIRLRWAKERRDAEQSVAFAKQIFRVIRYVRRREGFRASRKRFQIGYACAHRSMIELTEAVGRYYAASKIDECAGRDKQPANFGQRTPLPGFRILVSAGQVHLRSSV